MRKRVLSAVLMLAICLSALGFQACRDKGIQYASANLTMNNSGEFRILQLTDMHILGTEETGTSVENNYTLRDEWAFTCMDELITGSNPDMIMVTGDAVFTHKVLAQFLTKNQDNLKAFKEFCTFIDSYDIPWAFVFGNHDEEGIYPKKVLANYLVSGELKNCLFAKGRQDINGIGNYIININSISGAVITSLVMFDSGSYLKEKGANEHMYEYIHDDQLDWYEEAIRGISKGRDTIVPSLAFFHIPLVEYATAWDMYKAGSDEVEYNFGRFADSKVCHSYVGELNGVTYNGGNAFQRFVELGSTKGCFCGHDHTNYYSVTYQGIMLTYGKSVDYSAYGFTGSIYNQTEQRGGTLITIKADSSFDVEQIDYTRNLYQEALAAANA